MFLIQKNQLTGHFHMHKNRKFARQINNDHFRAPLNIGNDFAFQNFGKLNRRGLMNLSEIGQSRRAQGHDFGHQNSYFSNFFILEFRPQFSDHGFNFW